MKITNLTNSPYQLVDAKGKAVVLPARGEIDIDPHPMHENLYRQLGYFRIEEGGASAPQVDERDRLRAQYEQLTGEKPDGRWSADRLRDEIAEMGALQ